MKKNDWIFALSVLLYSLLFWKQAPGFNFLLMNGVLLAGIIFKDNSVLRNRNWWFSAAGALVSAFCVFLYGDPFSIFANLFSLLLVSSFVVNRQNSLLVALLHSFCNVCVSMAYMIVDGIARRQNKVASGTTGGSVFGKRFLIVLVALFIVIVFFFMYRSSNVLFDKLAEKISLDFISIPWCLFTIAGALVLYGYYYHHALPGLSEWDNSHALELRPSETPSWIDWLMSISSEKFSVLVLLSLLNILLLVVNGLDAAFLFAGDHALPEGVTYTEYVHQGVGMLILSIVCAMAIILYYFRGRLNFVENNGALRALAICWIVQNAFMLFSTACRNEMYVYSYGLTYKRIGVYIYLLLALIGLLTTVWKVLKKKTNAFLFRSNSWLFYAVMIISCPVNWDGLIAHYNLTKAVHPDLYYVESLSYRAYPELIGYYEAHPTLRFPDALKNQVFVFMTKHRTLSNDGKWPSKTIMGDKVYDQLYDKNQFGAGIAASAERNQLKHVYFFPAFVNTHYLNLGYNDLEDAGELGQYKNVEVLHLDYNEELASIKGVESMYNLHELYLPGTQVKDFSPLLGLSNLKTLVVSSISHAWESKLKNRFPDIDIRTNSYE